MKLFRRAKHARRRGWLFWGLIALAVIVFLSVLLSASIAIWPGFGAWGAEVMRAVIGERATAAIEGFFLSAADLVHRFAYSLGIGHKSDPFAGNTGTTDVPVSTVAASTTTTVPPGPTTTESGGSTTTTTNTTTTTTTEAPWHPAALQPMGTLDKEGQWSPYLVDTAGRTVGYRTALQPDEKRGFAVAAVIAMDLAHTRLHFVLGFQEPKSAKKFDRPGTIPENDLQPGRILGAFNGGFQAEHGQFGAMADGNEALPPIEGFGTIAIYKDGRVSVGAWGTDIVSSPDMESWRQNGPLVISAGQVGPEVENSDPHIWGFVYGGGVAAWRSAVGVSEDGRTLYSVVGPSLTIQSLAAAMLRAGIWNGFELDINHAWTRFDKATFKKGKLVAVPVLDGIAQDNRLFQGYKRDFFYLTATASD